MAELALPHPPQGAIGAETRFVQSVAAAFVAKVAMAIGLDGLFAAFGAAGEWVAALLPWALLLAALAFLSQAFLARGRKIELGPQRRHVIGWLIVAAILVIMFFIGGVIEPTLKSVIGKAAKVVVNFTESQGLFWAAGAALIAASLAITARDPASGAAPGAIQRTFVSNLTAKVAGVPMALVAVGVFAGGTIWTVVYSFTGSKLLPKTKWVGLDQYERLWGSNRWITSIENLMIYGVCSLILSFSIGFLLAALIDQKIRFENTFRTIILYPFALSFIVTGLVWQWVLNPEFGVQSIIRGIGWIGFTFDPLYNADIVIFGILIAGLWQGTGLIMVIMLAGLRGIDQEIWKASRVDGIPAWKTYLYIVIPMMRPVFITTLVLIASGIVRLYDLVVAQTSGGPGIASEVPAKYVYDKMFLGQNLGQGFAASTMMLLAVAIVIIPWAYLEFGSKKRV